MISIIITSYNSAHFIIYAIESILSSELKQERYEVIVVNDGSSDNILDVMKSFNQYDNIITISQKNKGLAGARNTGIKKAKGKYLVFLDADDVVMPDKLSKQIKYLESNSKIDIVYSNSVFFDDNDFNKEFPTSFPEYDGNVLRNLLYGNFIHVNSVMVRKEKVIEVGCFDENFRELEDWDLWLRMSLQGSNFGYIPEVLSKVRVHRNSMTSNQSKMDKAMLKTLLKFGDLLSKSDKYEKLKKDYLRALSLFSIKSKDNRFHKFNNEALFFLGVDYSYIYLKNLLKWWLVKMNLFATNKTTRTLEKVWGNV